MRGRRFNDRLGPRGGSNKTLGLVGTGWKMLVQLIIRRELNMTVSTGCNRRLFITMIRHRLILVVGLICFVLLCGILGVVVIFCVLITFAIVACLLLVISIVLIVLRVISGFLILIGLRRLICCLRALIRFPGGRVVRVP